jgi:hypothetical protein
MNPRYIVIGDEADGRGSGSHIGRGRTAPFGNSDGVLPVLQWATAGAGVRFALYVPHGDVARECP